MNTDNENFVLKVESFINFVAIPRETNEDLSRQCQETIYSFAQSLSASNKENLEMNLISFLRIIWNHLTAYLIHKYDKGNVIKNFKDSQGFGHPELEELLESNQEM